MKDVGVLDVKVRSPGPMIRWGSHSNLRMWKRRDGDISFTIFSENSPGTDWEEVEWSDVKPRRSSK